MALTAEAIDTAINAILADMDNACDYSIGDKSVSRSQKLRQLLDLRNNLAAIPQVDLGIMQMDCDIGLDGTDHTQTVIES